MRDESGRFCHSTASARIHLSPGIQGPEYGNFTNFTAHLYEMEFHLSIMRIAKAAAMVFFFAFLFTNCKKEYSYEGGTALFSILSVNDSCASPVISGDYNAGSTLGPSNTVQLQVDVTNPGKFALQTNTVNGIVFSTTSSFSDTGIQTLTLTATGKPSVAGHYVFTPEITPGCAFSVDVTGEQVPVGSYNIAGAPDACSNVQVLGQYQVNKPLTSSNIIVVNVNVVSPGVYTIYTDTLDGISFYASGHFTQMGNQTVTLTGSGTPLQPQNLQFNISGNSTGCTFPLTVENTGNPATYVIQSGLNLCVGLISGTYTAGTALNASNTYALSVYVATVGNYTISTQTTDGVIFYTTGTFTTLGTQDVTLVGSGTPINVGNFTMTPKIIGPAPLGGVACDFTMAVK